MAETKYLAFTRTNDRSLQYSLRCGFRMAYTETVDSKTNTSTMTILAILGKADTDQADTGAAQEIITLAVNGEEAYSGNFVFSSGFTQEEQTVCSPDVTLTFNHDNDGTLTVPVTITVQHQQGSAWVQTWTFTGDASAVLETVPRQSGLAVSGTVLGETTRITATRYVASFTHTLTAKCGSYSRTIASKSTADSWTVTLPAEWITGSGTTAAVTFTLTTWDGSTQIGSAVTQTVSMTAADSTLGVELSAAGTPIVNGRYLQGQSTVTLTASASDLYGGSITKAVFTAEGTTYTVEAAPWSCRFTPRSSGSITVTVDLSDSHGRTSSAAATLSVYGYTAPQISGFTAYRATNGGSEDDDGTCIFVAGTGSCTALGGKNEVSTTAFYRVHGSGEWTQITATLDGGGWLQTGISTGTMYDVKLEVTDTVGVTTTMTALIPTAAATVDLQAGGKGVTIGARATQNGFCIHMDTYIWDEDGTKYVTLEEYIRGIIAEYLTEQEES